MQAARSGRRVLVCTIDPSRRLATSLGPNQLSGKPRPFDLGRHSPAPARGGALWAMVLDVKSTFDALVTRYTKDAAARERILGNRFYRQISAALAGSHEYMAMVKLLELSADEQWDLLVLDTPHTRHAIDFLEAPARLLDFLDTRVLPWFLRPSFVAGQLTLKVASRTGAAALRLADRFLGLQFLQDLSEFFLAFESMYDGFKERAAKVHALLRDPSSGFVLVAGPSALALEEALYFHRRLEEKRMSFAIAHVEIGTNPRTRPSRLFQNVFGYIKKSTATIVRIYASYEPLKVFSYIGLSIFGVGFLISLRFVYYYLQGFGEGKLQSLILSAVLMIVGFQVVLIGLVADLISGSRKLLEDLLYRVRGLELHLEAPAHSHEPAADVPSSERVDA